MNRGNLLTLFNSEGVGVGLISCALCGAALLLDPRDEVNQVERHNDWHDSLTSRIRQAADTWVPEPRFG